MKIFRALTPDDFIQIHDDNVIRCDEFITFEVPSHWYLHARTCQTCKTFLDNITADVWIIENDNSHYRLIPNNFKESNYFDNFISCEINYDSQISRVKLKIEKIEFDNSYIQRLIQTEKYEFCEFIYNIQRGSATTQYR